MGDIDSSLPITPLQDSERIRGKVTLLRSVTGIPVALFRGKYWFATGSPVALPKGTRVDVLFKDGVLHDLCEANYVSGPVKDHRTLTEREVGVAVYRIHARSLVESARPARQG